MAEEQVDMEYISLHGYMRNTPSDTEVGGRVPGDAEWTGEPNHQKKNI